MIGHYNFIILYVDTQFANDTSWKDFSHWMALELLLKIYDGIYL